jgi:hypothetical protein
MHGAATRMLILIITNILETYSIIFITNISLFKVSYFKFFYMGEQPKLGPRPPYFRDYTITLKTHHNR